jgi:FkbM family methyltransferase
MNNISIDLVEVRRWFSDRGDFTHNITYDLDDNSTILDLGGYTGVWAQQMIQKYNPYVYLIEPVPSFYNSMESKFSGNSKVKSLNCAVGIENKDEFIYVNGDGTSSNLQTGQKIKVRFNTIEYILNHFNLSSVDLIQINIEGDEYPLLENMILTGSINRFKNIQIQFHLGVENCVERRNAIREKLIENNFKINFDYPFVWESWRKNE